MEPSKDLHCTIWNNEHIYSSLADSKIQESLQEIRRILNHLQESRARVQADLASLSNNDFVASGELLDLVAGRVEEKLKSDLLFGNLLTFTDSLLAVNGANDEAKAFKSQVIQLQSELAQAYTPYFMFLQLCNEKTLELLLEHPGVRPLSATINHQRKMSDFLLSSEEEALITAFSTDGFKAWGNLYQEISGKMRVAVDGEVLGLADAANLLRQGDRELRKKAWEAISSAWEDRSETAGAILNSINGWRLENTKQREFRAGRKLHYLDQSCHTNKISRRTLDTLMEVAYEKREVSHRGLRAMAKLLGINQLEPWDILAPPPLSVQQYVPFTEAMDIVCKAFNRFSPEMGEFAQMMYDRGWIDSKASENRRGGAYCTKFYEPREPRVFMTYGGQLSHILTLAHELGHAYHNWVMRDMPLAETVYAMTTAETASIFAEALVKDSLLSEANNDQAQLNILWQEAEGAGALLVNIPARFEFEKSLVERRTLAVVSSRQMQEDMGAAWAKWYGDTLGSYDSMFWASKLHFSISGLAFYNYPYLFGYLFSLGVYAKKDELGTGFHQKYVELLRDTGVLTAEDLIRKHFDQDISRPEFWENSISIVESSVAKFEERVAAYGKQKVQR